jgi:hypothetical protein
METIMKQLAMFVALSLVGAFVSNDAWAQFNLRTIPASPTAGAAFQVAFDENECQAIIVDINAPTLLIQGTAIRIEVDFLEVIDCGGVFQTHTVTVPALSQGSYTIELIGRPFQSAADPFPLQTVVVLVGPASVDGRVASIPAFGSAGRFALIGAMLLMALALAPKSLTAGKST